MKLKELNKVKTITYALFLGVVFGVLSGLIVSKIFVLVPFFREVMPLQTMLLIFVSNSFLATLICYGGLLFSLAEIKAYSFPSYKLLDKLFNPFYNFLGKFSSKIKRLKSMYRSCYFSLYFFPLGCIFLFSFLISNFFSIFLSLLGFSVFPKLAKLFPHISLETLAFSFSAFQALKIKEKIEKYIFKEEIEKYKEKSKKVLKDKKILKKLLFSYAILFISSLTEKFFVEL